MPHAAHRLGKDMTASHRVRGASGVTAVDEPYPVTVLIGVVLVVLDST
jgi:hypothetical protein